MLDVTLKFNDLDLSDWLSTYRPVHELEESDKLTALDRTEYFSVRERPVVVFSLIPLTDAQCAQLYSELSKIVGEVTYTDPYLGDTTRSMRVMTKLEAIFGLRSIDGNRYYKGGEITLRSRTVL